MRLLSIGGTRPQFVKMAVLANSVDEYNRLHPGAIEHRLLHTGQHSDPDMSDVFFNELAMPQPVVLKVPGSQTPGHQTAIMLANIESELLNWQPDAVISYGDTNSTVAAALAAAKLHIPLIHLEAGLRSFNRLMQEEINRIVTDHISDLLLCPTHSAVKQLGQEGLGDRAVFVGDVMLDAVRFYRSLNRPSAALSLLNVQPGRYVLLTLHRAETTDDPARLRGILNALNKLELPVIFPMHPRLRARLAQDEKGGLFLGEHIHVLGPVGYPEMLSLQRNARFIMTDSGGLQKEAYFMGVPCLTLRDETEWRETLEDGWNTLVGSQTEIILEAAKMLTRDRRLAPKRPRNLVSFGDGKAGQRSVEQIVQMVRSA